MTSLIPYDVTNHYDVTHPLCRHSSPMTSLIPYDVTNPYAVTNPYDVTHPL